VVTSAAQKQYTETARAELEDVDARLANARSAVEEKQREVDLLAAQHNELHRLIRQLEELS
jgi:hypothetical protein